MIPDEPARSSPDRNCRPRAREGSEQDGDARVHKSSAPDCWEGRADPSQAAEDEASETRPGDSSEPGPRADNGPPD
eukprot:7466077-Alexandrium_andersonii.AAC.1